MARAVPSFGWLPYDRRSRRIAGHGRGQGQVRCHQAVGQAQRRLPERGHEEVGDPSPQTGLDKSARDEEGDDDEPDHSLTKTADRLLDRERASETCRRDAEHGDRTHRVRVGDDAHDRGHEDGQQMPRLGIHAVWGGNDPQCDTHGQRACQTERSIPGQGSSRGSEAWGTEPRLVVTALRTCSAEVDALLATP